MSPLLAFVASPLLLLAIQEPETPPPGALFDEVVAVLQKWYYDEPFRDDVLPGLALPLAERARDAESLEGERAIVDELLAQVPSSHVALLSLTSYHRLGAELFGNTSPTFGLQLVHQDGRYHAAFLYEGGPAHLAGIRRGDEVLAIDGAAPGLCPRLDWSTDDAALPDAPIHALNAEEGDVLRLRLARTRDDPEPRTVELVATPYSGWQAAEESARVLEHEGRRVGYVHFWFFQFDKPSELLREHLEGTFADCDALVLDLRGRGGSAREVDRLMRLLDPEDGSWSGPVAVLTDRRTRSAKEVFALRVQETGRGQVVGESTAGAVVPASFREVGQGAVLMFPAMTVGEATDKLEGKGVAPDVPVEDVFAFSAGADPILSAALEALVSAAAPVETQDSGGR